MKALAGPAATLVVALALTLAACESPYKRVAVGNRECRTPSSGEPQRR